MDYELRLQDHHLTGCISMQLPAGYLGDKYGRKRMLALGPVLGATTVATALYPSFTVASAARPLGSASAG